MQTLESDADWIARWNQLYPWSVKVRQEVDMVAPGTDAGDYLLPRFPVLCDKAMEIMASMQPLADYELAVTVGLALLAPDDPYNPPTAELWRELCLVAKAMPIPELISEARKEKLSRWFGLVIWRVCRLSQADGKHPETLARRILEHLVRQSIRTTGKEILRLTPAEDKYLLEEALLKDPRLGVYTSFLALDLLNPGYCMCGRKCCPLWHNIHSWDPTGGYSFNQFIERAVRGSLIKPIQGNAFEGRSMLYPHLYRDEGLEVGSVLIHICSAPECQEALVTAIVASKSKSKNPAQEESPVSSTKVKVRKKVKALKVEVSKPGVHLGLVCENCHRPNHPDRTYNYLRRGQILIPYALGGSYQREFRAKCTTCWNYYDLPEELVRAAVIREELKAMDLSKADRANLLQEQSALKKIRKKIAQAHPCPFCKAKGREGRMSQNPTTVWFQHNQRLVCINGVDPESWEDDSSIGDEYNLPKIYQCEGLGSPELLVELKLSYQGMESERVIIHLSPWPSEQWSILLRDEIVWINQRIKAPLTSEHERDSWIRALVNWWEQSASTLFSQIHSDRAALHAAAIKGVMRSIVPENQFTQDVTLFVPQAFRWSR